jgi:hypothetical protein
MKTYRRKSKKNKTKKNKRRYKLKGGAELGSGQGMSIGMTPVGLNCPKPGCGGAVECSYGNGALLSLNSDCMCTICSWKGTYKQVRDRTA